MKPPKVMGFPITVLIVDNHANARTTLRKALGLDKRVKVVGEAINGADAILKVRESQPNAILMDVKMPKMNGIEATRYIKKHYPEIKVLVFSSPFSKSYFNFFFLHFY